MNFNNFLNNYKQKGLPLVLVLLAVALFNPFTVFLVVFIGGSNLFSDQPLWPAIALITWALFVTGWVGVLLRELWGLWLTLVLLAFFLILFTYSGFFTRGFSALFWAFS